MHYLLLTFSLILHYLNRYICILNVFIYVYGQLSAIKKNGYYENDGYSAVNSNPLIIIISP